MKLRVYPIGRVEYEDGLELQRLFGDAVRQKQSPNVLLLLEHPPVITLGRGARRSNVIATEEVLARRGVEIFETNRGGDVTYHGPGQLVGYPIFQLEGKRQDVRRYVRDLEEVLIQTVARFGIQATRIPKWTGVWIGEGLGAQKIGAIGVHLARWQTSHGFALNVNTDLSHFGLIVPCGIREGGVTSMAQELGGNSVEMETVVSAVASEFGRVFDSEVERAEFDLRTASVCVWRRDGDGPKVLLLRRTQARGGFWQIVTGRHEPDETIVQTAERELFEETGFNLQVNPLNYTHAFALGSRSPPLVVEESAFEAILASNEEVRLNAQEHEEFEWVSPDEAMRRIPYKGLRVAVAGALESH